MLEIGQPAPPFTLNDNNEVPVNLSDLKGKTVVLFFYPRADTPGCTREACSFRDTLQSFEANTVIFGISPDTVIDQGKFADKFDLPYKLLADDDHAIAEAYGVWVEKNNYGKKYMGVDRTTFIIAPDGTIQHIFKKVKPDDHARQVLNYLQTL
jgi:peroxiredoxin Q/BCP